MACGWETVLALFPRINGDISQVQSLRVYQDRLRLIRWTPCTYTMNCSSDWVCKGGEVM